MKYCFNFRWYLDCKEATVSLLGGVCSLLAFTAPILAQAFVSWGCLYIHNGDFDRCAYDYRLRALLLLYHLVYNSIIYALRSREFRATLTAKCSGPPIQHRLNAQTTLHAAHWIVARAHALVVWCLHGAFRQIWYRETTWLGCIPNCCLT